MSVEYRFAVGIDKGPENEIEEKGYGKSAGAVCILSNMNMRRFIIFLLSTGFIVFLSLDRAGANSPDVVYLPEESLTQWNPYPSLGTNAVTGESCVSPGGSQFSSGYTSAIPPSMATTMLNPADYDFGEEEDPDAPLASTRDGGELYLSRIPSGKRTGVFQKVNFNALWAPKHGGSKGLGMTQLDLSATFAVPMLKPESPLVITPSFQAWFFDPKTDGYMTKKTLYTTGVDVRWIRPLIRNKLTLDIGASALYSGDFHIKGSKAMRYPAHAATIWNCNPRLKVILGVLYLDREDDYNWLPMAGLVWTPHEDLSVELVIPRLRIAQRIRWFGSAAGDDKSDWLYAGFEFGGGSWGFEVQDVKGHIDYRDFRLLLGYERRTSFGMTIGFEVGYMFERKLEFDRLGYKTYPGDNVFLRLRTTF